MGQKTALGSLLKSIGNSGQGKVVPGWGAVPVMAFIGVLLLVFLVPLFTYQFFFVTFHIVLHYMLLPFLNYFAEQNNLPNLTIDTIPDNAPWDNSIIERHIYSSEDLDTGIKEIDAIETAYTLDSLGFQLALEQTTTFNQGIRLEDNSGLIGIFETGSVSGYPGSTSSDKIIGEDEELNGAIIAENTSDTGFPEYIIQEEYVVGDMSRDKTAQNELFDVLDDTILDFTESNPFGDAGTKG